MPSLPVIVPGTVGATEGAVGVDGVAGDVGVVVSDCPAFCAVLILIWWASPWSVGPCPITEMAGAIKIRRMVEINFMA